MASDMSQFIKRLDLPGQFKAPAKLSYDDIEATVLTRADLDDDVRGNVVRERDGTYLGCCYLYPTGWVTAVAYEQG
jgi:hypothetical protein